MDFQLEMFLFWSRYAGVRLSKHRSEQAWEFKSCLKFTPLIWCLDKSEVTESSALQLLIPRRENSLLRWICNTLWLFDSTRQQMNSQQKDCLISGGFLWSGHCVAAAEGHLPIWGRTCVFAVVHLCVCLICIYVCIVFTGVTTFPFSIGKNDFLNLKFRKFRTNPSYMTHLSPHVQVNRK